MQQKLLTVIEKRETQRIGSNKVSRVDVRILAATNAHLREKVGEGTFRQDLFYRLNTIELHLPPLRERGEDIVLLAEYFLKIYSGKYSVGDVVLGTSAKQKLLKHTWPGNVRELQHCIERAIVLMIRRNWLPRISDWRILWWHWALLHQILHQVLHQVP